MKMDVWLHRIWGGQENAPDFETMDQAQHIIGLILRYMNGIIWTLQEEPECFDPVLPVRQFIGDPKKYLDAEGWASGFMEGLNLCRADWQALFDDPAAREALQPIYLLGAPEVSAEEDALTRTPAQREKLALQIPESVHAIYRYWLPFREAVYEREVAKTYQREHPKVGRNDPCPCGSGKKFKKCCGVASTLH